MRLILYLRLSLAFSGRWPASSFKHQQADNASMCLAQSTQLPKSWSPLPMTPTLTRKVSVSCWINCTTWTLACPLHYFWIMRVISIALWWLKKPSACKSSCVSCLLTRRIWTWSNACGSLSRRNACIRNTIRTFMPSKLQSTIVLSRLPLPTKQNSNRFFPYVFRLLKKHNSHPCEL